MFYRPSVIILVNGDNRSGLTELTNLTVELPVKFKKKQNWTVTSIVNRIAFKTLEDLEEEIYKAICPEKEEGNYVLSCVSVNIGLSYQNPRGRRKYTCFSTVFDYAYMYPSEIAHETARLALNEFNDNFYRHLGLEKG